VLTLSYINTALSQSAFRIYKCYIIIVKYNMSYRSMKASCYNYMLVYKPCVISFLLLAVYVPVLFVLFLFSSQFFCTLHCTQVKYLELQNMGSPVHRNNHNTQKLTTLTSRPEGRTSLEMSRYLTCKFNAWVKHLPTSTD
jgi:hypothetical protein